MRGRGGEGGGGGGGVWLLTQTYLPHLCTNIINIGSLDNDGMVISPTNKIHQNVAGLLCGCKQMNKMSLLLSTQ